MKKLLSIIVLSLALAAPAHAQKEAGLHSTYQLGTLLNAVSLNAVAGSRTFTVSSNLLKGYNKAFFHVAFTHANNGTLTLTCTGGPTAADNAYAPTTCTVSTGTCTLNFAGVFVTPSLTTDKSYTIEMGVGGVKNLSCVMAHGGSPAAGDVVTIKGELEAN